MFSINEGELLLKVSDYEILRGDERLHIRVYERIAGESHHTFMAYPMGLIGKPEENFVGFGDSEIEALRGCLNRIKNVSIQAIVEDSINSQLPPESGE